MTIVSRYFIDSPFDVTIRPSEAKRIGGFEIDHHLEFGRLQDRQVGQAFVCVARPTQVDRKTISVPTRH